MFNRQELFLKTQEINFLYKKTEGYQLIIKSLYYLMKKNKHTITNIEKLEINNLNDLYEFFIKINEKLLKKDSIAMALLLTISLAKAPINKNQLLFINKNILKDEISSITPIAIQQIQTALNLIKEVIREDKFGNIKLYHPSFQDFIKEKYKEGSEEIIKGFLDYFLAIHQKLNKGIDYEYFIRYSGFHLYEWYKIFPDDGFEKILYSFIDNFIQVNDTSLEFYIKNVMLGIISSQKETYENECLQLFEHYNNFNHKKFKSIYETCLTEVKIIHHTYSSQPEQTQMKNTYNEELKNNITSNWKDLLKIKG